VGEQKSRSGPGDSEHDTALGQRGLLSYTCRKIRVRAAQSLRGGARDGLDLPLELVDDEERATRHGGQHLDGAVVVGRAEPARHDADVGLQAFTEHGGEVAGTIADEDDARGLDSPTGELGGEKRAVGVAVVAADELATGDDDEGPKVRRS
jgi:hypothetical protein